MQAAWHCSWRHQPCARSFAMVHLPSVKRRVQLVVALPHKTLQMDVKAVIAVAQTYQYSCGALPHAVPHLRIAPPCTQLQRRQQRRTHHARGAVIIIITPTIISANCDASDASGAKWLCQVSSGPRFATLQTVPKHVPHCSAFRKSALAPASADSSSSHIRISRLACSVVSDGGHRC